MTTISHQTEHKEHPNYLAVFIVLAVLTAVMTTVEVMDFEARFGIARSVINTFYLILSGIKAVLVAMYYMHLKFDSRLYTYLFVAPMILLILLVVILLGRFGIY